MTLRAQWRDNVEVICCNSDDEICYRVLLNNSSFSFDTIILINVAATKENDIDVCSCGFDDLHGKSHLSIGLHTWPSDISDAYCPQNPIAFAELLTLLLWVSVPRIENFSDLTAVGIRDFVRVCVGIR